MNQNYLILGIMSSLLCASHVHAQSASDDSEKGLFPPQSETTFRKFIELSTAKTSLLTKKLNNRYRRTIRKFRKRENRLRRGLTVRDSMSASIVFGDAEQQYGMLDARLSTIGDAKVYIGSLDTLQASLSFLQQHPNFLANSQKFEDKLKSAILDAKELTMAFEKGEVIKQYFKERKQYLIDRLGPLGMGKSLKKINQEFYYFSAHLKQYREFLKDRRKVEEKAIAVLRKTKLFKDFLRRNSQLASIFCVPGHPNTLQTSYAGLQTRSQVNNFIQQQLGGAGADARQQFSQNIQEAQSQLQKMKEKARSLGIASSNEEKPDGFIPNNQKTKSFLQRLEIGFNIQSQRPNGLLPVTSDLGFSLGYKLHDRSIIGIGVSYKMGWGKNIRHIRISHQGVGLRSFADWRIKRGLWISGGYEMNYRTEFKKIELLRDLSAWQHSGLIGTSKVLALKTKFFKNTKLQLLWDMLSYRQMPRTQPFVFRIGYSFN